MPLTGIDLYNSNQTDPALTYSMGNPTSYNTTLTSGGMTGPSYNTASALNTGAINNPYSNVSNTGLTSNVNPYSTHQNLNNNYVPPQPPAPVTTSSSYNPAPGGKYAS